MGRRLGQKNHGGAYSKLPVHVRIDSLLAQKLEYAVRSGFRVRPGPIIELALDAFFDAHPTVLEGFAPDASLEVKAPSLSGLVYLAHCPDTGLHKIGRSKNPVARLSQLSSVTKTAINLVCQIPVDNMKQSEAAVHGVFASKRSHGEWFRLTPADVRRFKSADIKGVKA